MLEWLIMAADDTISRRLDPTLFISAAYVSVTS
jgi:hypothetical protein